ncbi:MAG TPA: hypothetical protein DDW96_01130 [Synergistaceae bacterium]|nr:hypothetical protein [Synergistaceae bacterium]
MMSRRSFASIIVFLLLSLAFAGASWGQDVDTPEQMQDQIDLLVHGEKGAGGIIQRLAKVETDLFGRELPGSISERQMGLLNFVKNGTLGQPSMVFKAGLAEWAITHEVRPDLFLARRIAEIERQLEGEVGEGRPLAMRLERLLSLLFPGQIAWQDVNVPANLVFKATFVDRVTPRSAVAGDIVRLKLEDNLAVGSYLIAPRGSRVIARVDTVKPPRSFGRPSEIKFAFERLEPLGPEAIPVFLGDASALAAKSDVTVATAMGTSAVGAILLGPLGLAGGLLVRGDAPDVAPGTAIFLETASVTAVKGYPVPPSLLGLLGGGQDVAPAGQVQGEFEQVSEGGDLFE